MKRLLTFLLLTISSSLLTICEAQDPAFSQPYSNPLYLNPAFAGTSTSQRIGLNYGIESPNYLNYYGFSYDRNIIDSSIGIGIMVNQQNDFTSEDYNSQNTTNASLVFSYQFHIKAFTLSVGAQGTYTKNIVNSWNDNMADIIEFRSSLLHINAIDFSTGLLGYGKYYFVGFTVDHITQPDIYYVNDELSPLPIKYVFNAGGMVPIGSFKLYPTFLYESQQPYNLTIGECYIASKHLTFGIGYTGNYLTKVNDMGLISRSSWSDGMIFTFGFQSKFLHFGYSYYYTATPRIRSTTSECSQFSLAVLLPYKCPRLKKVNGINCPAF